MLRTSSTVPPTTPAGSKSHVLLAWLGSGFGSLVPMPSGLVRLVLEPKSPLAEGVGMKDETSQRLPSCCPHRWTVRSKTTGLILALGLAKSATCTSISLAKE